MVSTIIIVRRRRSVCQSSSPAGILLLPLLLLLIIIASITLVEGRRRRLDVAADRSIVTEIEAAHAIGNYGSLFTLRAEFVVDADDDAASASPLAAAPLLHERPMSAGARDDDGGASSSAFGGKSAPEMALRVREATPAIDAATTYSVENGNGNDDGGGREAAYVNEKDIATMLVSDMEGVLAFIAVGVNGDERTTRGIIKSGSSATAWGTGMHFEQKVGQKAFVSAAADFTPPPFACGVNAKQEDRSSSSSTSSSSSSIFNKKMGKRRKKRTAAREPVVDTATTNNVDHHLQHGRHHHHRDVHESRILLTSNEEEEDDHHEEYHRSHHDHHDHHHLDPSSSSSSSSSSNMAKETMVNLRRDLRLSQFVQVGKRRRSNDDVQTTTTTTTTAPYTYWVDIYIEIDIQLCTANGETTIGPRTLNYINALFVGANTIFETEIDTHLHVLHVELNANYDTTPNTYSALDIMTTKFGRAGGWHYTSPTGIQPDLHHTLLSRNLGGGVAYVGVVCNPNDGFGLSTGLSGEYQSMGNSLVWDMFVFMHELGHNFGTYHTHDYSPTIDTCGSGTCPIQLPQAKSATLMSYCHICTGGFSNIDYTFGGKFVGGPRSSIDSYTNSVSGNVSNEPRRVNVNMYNHVSQRGICTLPSGTEPPRTSSKPTSSPPTFVPTSKPTYDPASNPTCLACPSGATGLYPADMCRGFRNCVTGVDRGITSCGTGLLFDEARGYCNWSNQVICNCQIRPPSLAPTNVPTTLKPSADPTSTPITSKPTTSDPTNSKPTTNPTFTPTTSKPTTSVPTSSKPTEAPSSHRPTNIPTVVEPGTSRPSASPSISPLTPTPTSSTPSNSPTTTAKPSTSPSTTSPITFPSTVSPTSNTPTTNVPTTLKPSADPTSTPSTSNPTTSDPTNSKPTTNPTFTPTTSKPTTSDPTPTPTSSKPTEAPSSHRNTSIPTVVEPGTARPSASPSISPLTPTPTSSTPSNSPTTAAKPSTSPSTSPITFPSTVSPTSNTPTTSTTSTMMMNVEIRILTDHYPKETTWNLTDICTNTSDGTNDNDVFILRGGPYTSNSTWYSITHELPTGKYKFVITDRYNDGICCAYGTGQYKIIVDGDTVHTSRGKFKSYESKTIGTSCVNNEAKTIATTIGNNAVEHYDVKRRQPQH